MKYDSKTETAGTVKGNTDDIPSPCVQVIALPELQTALPIANAPSVIKDYNPLYQVKVQLQVCIGEATMTVGELLSAKEHQVLQLDSTLDQPVNLLLEGKVVAHGQLVAVDNHFAVRITQLPIPLQFTS